MKFGLNLNFLQSFRVHCLKENSVKKNLTSNAVTKKTKTRIKETKVQGKQLKKSLIKHFENSPVFQNNQNYIGKNLLRRYSYLSSDPLYCLNEEIAKKIVDSIKQDLVTENSVVFEMNPGIGLITKELLKLNIPKIYCFENNPLFKTAMHKLENDFPDRLIIRHLNLLCLGMITVKDKYDNRERIKNDVMKGIEERNWEDDPRIKIIGALPSKSFLRSIIYNIIFRNGLMPYGRPELYCLIDPKTFVQIVLDKNAQFFYFGSFPVLFRTFFNFNFITSVLAKEFIPWIQSPPRRDDAIKNYNFNPEEYYLIKAVPKQNVFEIIPPHLMKPFWFFTRYYTAPKRLRVIPSLEKWIPGCGPKLISLGIGVYTEFRELSPEEIVQVFLVFTEFSQFNSSSFLAAVDHTLMKTEVDFDEQEDKLENNETETNLDLTDDNF